MSQKFDQEDKIVFKDLQSLLQKTLGHNIRVLDLRATKFLPVGENYCSTMIKLDATVGKNNSTEQEILHLVAKTMDKSERPILDWTKAFKKEVFIYSEILPAYRNLENKMNVLDQDLIDLLPKYYGHRFSLNNKDSEAGEDSVLLMENLKVKGFYMCDRYTGFDVFHTKKVLSSLARYHALGIALKHKNPTAFKKIKEQAQVVSQNMSLMDEGFRGILKNVLEEPGYKKHSNLMESSFAKFMGGKIHTELPEEPWATITHGDLWVNNVLFHKNDRDEIDAVKFVDFQIYSYSSPLRDLAFFICTSVQDKVLLHNVDELLNAYYESFVKTLKKMNCDLEPFCRSAFDQELKKQAISEFPFAALVCKFSLWNVEEKENDELLVTNVYHGTSNDAYKKKLSNLLGIFETKKWL